MIERQSPAEERDPREAEQIAIGLGIVGRIRTEVNAPNGYFDTGDPEQDIFSDLYLKERDGAVPEHLVSDGGSSSIEQDIRVMLASVFNEVRTELDLRMGREESHWVYVDPAPDDHSTVILCTDRSVLSLYSIKPWRFYWETEEEMAETLGYIYEAAAERLLAERQRPTTYGTTTT